MKTYRLNLAPLRHVCVVSREIKLENAQDKSGTSNCNKRRTPSFEQHLHIVMIDKFSNSAQQHSKEQTKRKKPECLGGQRQLLRHRSNKDCGRDADEYFGNRGGKWKWQSISSCLGRIHPIKKDCARDQQDRNKSCTDQKECTEGSSCAVRDQSIEQADRGYMQGEFLWKDTMPEE